MRSALLQQEKQLEDRHVKLDLVFIGERHVRCNMLAREEHFLL